MRCRRCHARLAPGKKICPNCGTLVRKRRGSVKLAPSVGGSWLDNFLSSHYIDPRKILLGIIIAGAAAAVIYMFASGCVSCGSCGGCSACASCSSCKGCISCDACLSCGACDSCGSCASCSGDDNAAEYPVSNNSSRLSSLYCDEQTLYFACDSCLMARNGTSNSVAAPGSGITNVCGDSLYVYYLQGGSVWRIAKNRQPIDADDPMLRYGVESVLDVSSPESAAGVVRVTGFSVYSGVLAYWGAAEDGGYRILTRAIGENTSAVIHTGSLTNVQAYRDKVYFISRDDADNGILYGVSVMDGSRAAVSSSPVSYYAAGAGGVYAYSSAGGTYTLTRISSDSFAAEKQWTLTQRVDGLLATDNWIFYYHNDEASGTGTVYYMEPGGSKFVSIFQDNSIIEVTGIAGDWFLVCIDISKNDDGRLDRASALYYLINAKSRERFSVTMQ